MNIFFTGHKGLIGNTLKERLEGEGHKIVKTLDRRAGTILENLPDCKLDEKVDLFIHAAAHCRIKESIEDPKKDFKSNVLGTHNVFEFCRENEIPKIVYFSTSRVLSPERNPYTAGKQFGEELCKAYNKCYGLDHVIIRPSTVYGPFWDKSHRLTHKFITRALKGEDLEIYGDPETKTLDFTYVTDFVDATMLAIDQKNEDYNISGNQETNLYNLAKMVIDYSGSSSSINVLPAEKQQPQKVNLDTSKIMALGYKPKVSVEDGFKRTIDWYRDHLTGKGIILKSF